MTRNYIQSTIRFDTRKQMARLKAAALKNHWTLNRFLLQAAERMADEVLGNEPKFEHKNWGMSVVLNRDEAQAESKEEVTT